MFVLKINVRYDKLFFTFAAIILSILIFLAYLTNTSVGAFQPASLARVLEGSATRPYAYRILIPALARFFTPIVPHTMTDWFANSAGAVRVTFDRLSVGGYQREAAVVLILMLGCLTGFVFVERTLLADLGFGQREQFIWPLAIQIMILPVTLFTGFYYDFPQMLLITISLLCLHRKNWLGYLLVLTLANFNKETSVFLVAVFIIHYWTRLPRKEFFKVLAGQVVICGVARGIILYWFRHNPGAAIFFTWLDQIKLFREHPLGLIFTILYFSLAIFLLLKHWRQKNDFLRSASVLGAIILGLFFTSGYPLEFRVFLDALPVLGVLFFFPPVLQRSDGSVIDKH